MNDLSLPMPVPPVAYPAPLCRHVMPSGLRCRSPRLAGPNLFCFFHNRLHNRNPDRIPANGKRGLHDLPFIEERDGVKIAINEIARALVRNEITERKAGVLAYCLQIAMQASPVLKDAPPQRQEICILEDEELGPHVEFSEAEKRELEKLRERLVSEGKIPADFQLDTSPALEK